MSIVRGHLSAIFFKQNCILDNHVCIYFVVRRLQKESHSNYKRRQFVDLLRSYGAKKKLHYRAQLILFILPTFVVVG